MQKGKIIREIIGKVLEPEGFVFDKEIEKWGFLKEFKNSKGEIARQTIAFYFSNYKRKLFMVISCFSGDFDSYRINRFVPGCKNDGIEYSKDEEFEKVIETYADILKQYGLDFLKKIAEPPKENDYFRQEDYNKLFQEHETLAQKFITEQQINFDCITIEDAVVLMKNMLTEKLSKPFEDCRDPFLEMAAFYECVVRKTYPCKWIMKDMKTHIICKLEIDSKLKLPIFVPNEIYLAWKNGVDQLNSLII
ncbi:hypothetical protein RZO55_08645 [Clostridium boliviensis]|uniref:DUF4304 domain-containing protein n=1 Tax=Clostridium boliviensis TaxID=318465 RepID=A0ABU4GJ45_9CLOT|nr:hypothetical protein [Clostridium boliviensis]MDW2797642.1 hypothetical protein [Clostridium boliviensis]